MADSATQISAPIRQITKDEVYDAVPPTDFSQMLEIDRHLNRSSAFDKIISATHDHKMLSVSDRIFWLSDGKIEQIQNREELKIEVGTIVGVAIWLRMSPIDEPADEVRQPPSAARLEAREFLGAEGLERAEAFGQAMRRLRERARSCRRCRRGSRIRPRKK